MKSFNELVDRWPTKTDFAKDTGMSLQNLSNFMTRGSIPPHYWRSIIDGAKTRGLGPLTAVDLMDLASCKKGKSNG